MTILKYFVNEGKCFFAFVFLFAALIWLDQISKNFAGSIFLNKNFAFSLPLPTWLMYVIYICVLAGLVYYCVKNYSQLKLLSVFGLVFIFAGALSNITERIVLGYVRDFIYLSFLHLTGIYNLADFYILLGIVLLLISTNKKL